MLLRAFALITFSLAVTGIVAVGESAWGQLDPSSALLLNSGNATDSRDSGVDSGRYTVRPKDNKREDSSRPVRRPPPSPIESASTPAPIVTGQTEPTEIPNSNRPSSSSTKKTSDARPVASQPGKNEANPLSTEEVAQHQAGASELNVNTLELSIAPGYLYNDSQSTYSFRSYNMAAPTVGGGAKVWLSRDFGIAATYATTLSAHIADGSSKNTPVTQHWTTLGLRYRKSFSGRYLPSRLSVGVDYRESELKVPSDAVLRAKLRSTGPRILLEAEMSDEPVKAWFLGFTASPKLKHDESSNATTFSSGGNVDSNEVGFFFGHRYRFERSNTVYWQLSHRIEKNLFSGSASAEDPVSTNTPSGVGITNSFTLFELGYAWGN